MARPLVSISSQNEGLYFGKHYGKELESHQAGHFNTFSWSEITETIADIK